MQTTNTAFGFIAAQLRALRMTPARFCAASLALPLILIPSLALAANVTDTTPPTVVSIDFNPKSVDVTANSQSVAFTMHVTDDLSGVQYITATLTSPTVGQIQNAFLSLNSGTATDGTFTGSAMIPKFAESGTWHLTSVYLVDRVGNSVSLPPANFPTGSPTTLAVTSNQDIVAPTVVGSPVFSPTSVDVSSGDKSFTITLTVTDDVSGATFGNSNLALQSPSGKQHLYFAGSDFILTSGNNLNGTWQVTRTMPRYSEAGNWTVASLRFQDIAGNQTTLGPFGTAFPVAASPQDLTPPTVTSFDFSPKFIDTSLGAQNVTVTLNITDDLSGVDFSTDDVYFSFYHGFLFQSPSKGQSLVCCGFSPAFSMTAGTPTNGTWQANVSVPQFSEQGTWKASLYLIKDRVQNLLSLTTAQLAALSLPTDLVIIQPSLTSDGTVGATGGTVQDSTFGARAEIVLPANAVNTTTTVAIDVFSSPLDIPIPMGFSAFGSSFVNITLTPTPNFPLAAPGATIVLPLAQAGTPGAHIYLYSVDPTSGALVPVASTAGGFVIGTVDPGGLSATFTGVSHFSTFVGLVGTPTQMTANMGTTPQSAAISTAFANALAVTLLDASSNPVSGVNVTFTAPASGASGTFSNNTATIVVATNASGVASAPFTANGTGGGPYNVTAATNGVVSVNFSLTNTAGLMVTLNPANQTVAAFATATFTAAATGSPTPTVQWQIKSTGATFSDITGATSTTLSFTVDGSMDGFLYRAVFTNAGGSATTTPATLSVTKLTPTITWANPADITVGTPLSSTQLNATASVLGGFVYKPPATTQLSLGNGRTLFVLFTPSDAVNYTTATASVLINVVSAPVPAAIINVTSTTADGTYGAGAAIPITVTFSQSVTATGTPILALNSGGTAKYASGSGTPTLTFTYSVGAGESSAHLDYTSTSALTLNGGTIMAAGSPAVLTLPAPGAVGSLGANKNIVISTVMNTTADFVTGYGLSNPALRNDFTGFVGMQFAVGANPLMLTGLGRLCAPGNSTSQQQHLLKLVNASDGRQRGTVTLIMNGCTGGFVNGFFPSPITLQAGTYYVVSQEMAGGDKWYDYGTITTTNAAAATGIVYTVASNYVTAPVANSSYVPVNFQYLLTAPPPQYTLTTNISPAGGGTLVASPTGPAYPSSTLVQLTAIPANGCTFANFSGALSGNTNPQSVTMTGPLTVTANFSCAPPPPGGALLTSFVPTSLRNDFGSFVGMKFTVGANPMTVNALGRVCAPGNSQTHALKLVDASTGVDVPNGSAPVNMAGCTPGQFVYCATVGLTLPAGGSYYLVSQETSGGDKWYDYGAVTPTSAAAVNGPVYFYNGNYVMVNAPNASYVPVNLQYGAITTPTQYLLTTIVAPPGGGSITGSPSSANGYYNANSTVNLTAVPAGGCTFTSWTFSNTNLESTINPQPVLMLAATTATANFSCSAPPVTNFITGFTSTSLRNDYGDFVGMQFTVRGGNALSLASLGRICAPGNSGAHLLKLVNAATGVDVAGGSVMVNMANCTPGQFTYVALASPVSLFAGSYYLVSHEMAGVDKWYDHGLVVPTSDATVNGSVYFYSGNWFPQASPNTSYVPVSFQYSLLN